MAAMLAVVLLLLESVVVVAVDFVVGAYAEGRKFVQSPSIPKKYLHQKSAAPMYSNVCLKSAFSVGLGHPPWITSVPTSRCQRLTAAARAQGNKLDVGGRLPPTTLRRLISRFNGANLFMFSVIMFCYFLRRKGGRYSLRKSPTALVYVACG